MADENNDQTTPTFDETPAQPVVEDATTGAAEDSAAVEEMRAVATDSDAAPAAGTAAPADAPVSAEQSEAVDDAAASSASVEPSTPAESGDPAEPEEPAKPADQEKPAEPKKPAEPEEPKPVTAVSLGLLPEIFVSKVSTQLHFYAPEFVALPAVSQHDDDVDDDDRFAGGSRRNRRRRGSDGDDARDSRDSRDEPRQRQRAVEYITEPKAIKGSTRLEAKKQRRRDGRDAGRRRPVVTEAEFLARRESVDRMMVVRAKNGRTQIGVLEDNVLVEHYVARNQDASLIGNVYLGRVQNVLPSMEAAFVDIGRGRNAVLYSGEVDWEGVETGNQPRRIELALKPGDRVLVQVTKDPVGHKGARLTSQISLPGRYLVYVPGGSMNGISRKLPDNERARLKRILKEVLPESSGVIVRTAAEGTTEEQLTRDVQRLTAQWEHIQKQVKSQQAPALLHAEPDLLVKIVRDVFNEDFTRMLIQGDDAHNTIRAYLESVAPDLLERVETYTDEVDPFDAHRITEQIEKALDRKVWLPSGGSLVIDRTEAMTVVDVNTGKFVGTGGNLEETVTKNNLEAAEEIVRQLRLRDIGGIIVVDFIDMVLESNRDLVLRRLIECLSRDRTKHQVAEVTSLGLVQMTRKKLGLGLLETFSEACDVCAGRGVVVHHDPVTKHRGGSSSNSGNQGRRSRGGQSQSQSPSQSGQQSQPAQPAAANGGTHSITESAKSALAAIAASTIVMPEDAPIEVPEAPAATERPKKSRKKRGSDRKSAPKSEAEQMLDSVLDALPEPKAPGEGRNRRRVTTAMLTGTPAPVGNEPSASVASPDSQS
ncbi:Cytoplasmic axial filament protein CafA and Ribonuclease G [Microbacterium esteraromaticum]|uniref:Ribonuclease E n=1 Tax=Microbacterium esteraromaticum TaxID=57043 RepID=A0A1R4KFF3_9MICO|nr:Rne/Rng family ribonuclease [Microbacterium esteraromaticum]SJN43026.1 Cytoplasmic axial filament protein CafA and Ribonuclease G [Microbacterium esteraromaticum]